MNLREAAQQALEALDGVLDTYGEPLDRLSIAGGPYEALECRDAITALRAALAEPEQTPKGWIDEMAEVPEHLWKEWSEGYTAPTPRKPLTDEEIDRVTDQQWAQHDHKPIYAAHRAYARAIERAHGIGGEA